MNDEAARLLMLASDPTAIDDAVHASARDDDAMHTLLHAAARGGSADAFARVLATGVRPWLRSQHEEYERGSWFARCADSAREPAEKVAALRAVGVVCPPDALATHCYDYLGVRPDGHDHSTATQLLLEAGADVNVAIDEYSGALIGWTPLMVAVLNEQLAWVRQLVAAGADPSRGCTGNSHPWSSDYRMKVGATPIDWAKRELKRDPASKLWKAMLSALGVDGKPAKRAVSTLMKTPAKTHAVATKKKATKKTATKKQRAAT